MTPPVSSQIFLGFPVIALFFSALERFRPLARQRHFRRGWKADVAYYALGCLLGQFSANASLAAMLYLRHLTGFDLGQLAGKQPGWLQVAEIILISDFLGYFFHRLLHSNPWLWRFHQVHHSSRQMDWLAAARLHPVDKLLGDFVQLIPLLCLGFSDGPLLIYASILGLQMFLVHSNVRFDFGLLRWLIVSPDFHHWHHCDEPRAYNKNFAPHMVVLDRLFGTAYIPDRPIRPSKHGVRERTPEGFLGQLIQPFLDTAALDHGTKVQLLARSRSYEIWSALLFALWTRRRLATCPSKRASGQREDACGYPSLEARSRSSPRH